MEKIQRTFELERETKRTHRYREVQEGEPEAVGSLYVQKWVTGNPPPKKIKAMLEPID